MATITINGTTKLALLHSTADKDIYAEVLHGWETGNLLPVRAAATPDEVTEAYASASF